mmetsp:Transcript_108319/g.305385  ORF Transcript_108319/g.305385 Transcript_108319/m.305385 type:complete len:342 (+) Transcript_108319:558-1583(+)
MSCRKLPEWLRADGLYKGFPILLSRALRRALRDDTDVAGTTWSAGDARRRERRQCERSSPESCVKTVGERARLGAMVALLRRERAVYVEGTEARPPRCGGAATTVAIGAPHVAAPRSATACSRWGIVATFGRLPARTRLRRRVTMLLPARFAPRTHAKDLVGPPSTTLVGVDGAHLPPTPASRWRKRFHNTVGESGVGVTMGVAAAVGVRVASAIIIVLILVLVLCALVPLHEVGRRSGPVSIAFPISSAALLILGAASMQKERNAGASCNHCSHKQHPRNSFRKVAVSRRRRGIPHVGFRALGLRLRASADLDVRQTPCEFTARLLQGRIQLTGGGRARR